MHAPHTTPDGHSLEKSEQLQRPLVNGLDIVVKSMVNLTEIQWVCQRFRPVAVPIKTGDT